MPNVKMELEKNLNESLLMTKIVELMHSREVRKDQEQKVIVDAEKMIVQTVIGENI
jgi:hypothetical protein